MLPNPYKVRRKWRYQKAHQDKRETLGPKAPNPYRERDNPKPWRRVFFIALGFVSVITVLALLFLHPFFGIRTITVTGTERLTSTDIETGLATYLDTPIALNIPLTRRAYTLARVEAIRNWLLETYSLQDARVEKHFPSRLTIQVTERLSSAILDDGVSYRFVGQDGIPLDMVRLVDETEWRTESRIVTSTLADGTVRETTELVARRHEPRLEDVRKQTGNYPIIVYSTQTSVSSTATAVETIPPKIVERAIEWFEFLTKKTTIPFGYVKKNSQPGPYATIVTGEGFEIHISLDESADSAIPRFTALIDSKDMDRSKLQYVDVRYHGVVYWQ